MEHWVVVMLWIPVDGVLVGSAISRDGSARVGICAGPPGLWDEGVNAKTRRRAGGEGAEKGIRTHICTDGRDCVAGRGPAGMLTSLTIEAEPMANDCDGGSGEPANVSLTGTASARAAGLAASACVRPRVQAGGDAREARVSASLRGEEQPNSIRGSSWGFAQSGEGAEGDGEATTCRSAMGRLGAWVARRCGRGDDKAVS